jgi:hypothetical protein
VLLTDRGPVVCCLPTLLQQNPWDYFVTNTNALYTDGVQVWLICA